MGLFCSVSLLSRQYLPDESFDMFIDVVMPHEDTKMLEFNQYQKSEKTQFTIYTNFQSLIKEKQMDLKIIQRNHIQQMSVNIFHQAFQCLQYCHLKTKKISLIYTEGKIAWKNFGKLK